MGDFLLHLLLCPLSKSYPSLEAQILVLRLKSQTQILASKPNPSIKTQILASRPKSQPQGLNPRLKV